MNITATRKIDETAKANEVVTVTTHLSGGGVLLLGLRHAALNYVIGCLLNEDENDPRWLLDVNGRMVRMDAVEAWEFPDDFDLSAHTVEDA